MGIINKNIFELFTKEKEEVLYEFGVGVQKRAKELVPKKSGRLKNSIIVEKIDSNEIRVGSYEPYANKQNQYSGFLENALE